MWNFLNTVRTLQLILFKLDQQEELLMSIQDDLNAQIDAIKASVAAVAAKVDALKAQIAAGQDVSAQVAALTEINTNLTTIANS